MRKILALLGVLLASPALAQSPQLGAGQVLGNSTAGQRPGRSESLTAILDRAFGSTRGALIERGAGGWALFSPSATARVPYLSGGAGADPLYGAYTLPASVTSGGVPCFTSTTVQASSGLLSANAIVLGGGAGVCPSPMGSLGTTTTVLHGNAAGPPTFAAVVSADLNITATNCTNQFVSAISSGGVGTCTTDVLASAQHANQGTTTTVLHGNAAGNPAFGAVVSGDLNITPTTCTNQVVTAISAGGVGTCANISTNSVLLMNATPFINLAGGQTRFLTTGGGDASEANVVWIVPRAFILQNMRASVVTAPGGVQTATFTVRKNGGDGTLTCVITGAATTCNDLANQVSYAAGDTISLRVVASATAATTTNPQASFLLITQSP